MSPLDLGKGPEKLDHSYRTAANGNVLSQTLTVPTVGASTGFVAVQSYSYESLNRLKDATENVTPTGGSQSQSWKQTFVYDRYGNRNFDQANTTQPASFANPSVTNPTIDSTNNRFASGQGYSYDTSGDTTTDANGQTYVYDAENKMVSASDGGGTLGQYWYDGDGKRVKKYVPGTGETTVFVYDEAGKQIAEYSSIVANSTDAKVAYLTNDHLGSPRINTDQNGAVTARHDYHPFGEEIVTAQRATGLGYAADSVRKQFTGYERDNETDLDFAQSRYFSSSLGRFSTTDVPRVYQDETDPQSWNLFVYVRNNPLTFLDPLGTSPTDYVDDLTGQMTHIEDGKDQVIAASTGEISIQQTNADTNKPAYDSLLAALESNDINNLHLTRSEFMARAATTYAESSFPWFPAGAELASEMESIAWVNTRNGVAFGANSPDAARFKNTPFDQQDGKMRLANLAIVNQRRGGPDPSYGAVAWDGMEQAQYPDSDKRSHIPNPHGKGTWQLHKNTIGWSISDADYAKWKKSVGRTFRAPQVSPNGVGRIGYISSAVWCRTIFWRKQ